MVASICIEVAGAAYHPPVKRSVTIAGHQTSISLEPVFWRALETDARSRGVAVNALVAEIDAARLHAPRPPNLTSALRQYLFGGGGDGGTEALGATRRAVEE